LFNKAQYSQAYLELLKLWGEPENWFHRYSSAGLGNMLASPQNLNYSQKSTVQITASSLEHNSRLSQDNLCTAFL